MCARARTERAVERKKESRVKDKSNVKKVSKMEEQLKTVQRDMSIVKMKSMFAIAFAMITLFGMINSA